jgi:tetrahydromethanopterin S-methyltransferase subunit B
MPEQIEKIESGKEILETMFKGFSLVAERMGTLSLKVEKLEKALSDEKLITKVEDLTSSLDDHRTSINELVEVTDGIAGMFHAFLTMIEKAGEINSESRENDVIWSDLSSILKSIREEHEENEDDEESEEEDKTDS